MNSELTITLIADRRYAQVSIDQIKVINSRDRDEDQFQMNVQSIAELGLMKPIRVNDTFLETTGYYELICGEGRLTAHRRLGQSEIPAEIVSVSRKEAYLQSLIENIARTRPGTMDFAREVKRLSDEGWSTDQIARVTTKTVEYIRHYLTLVDQGEDRLIAGVEQGIFPITFALMISQGSAAQVQHLLMDAFDQGIVTTSNFAQARRLIMQKANGRKKGDRVKGKYTVDQLKKDIHEATKQKSTFVRQAQAKENRFLTLLTGINHLWRDERFVFLLTDAGFGTRPELLGDFVYDTP